MSLCFLICKMGGNHFPCKAVVGQVHSGRKETAMGAGRVARFLHVGSSLEIGLGQSEPVVTPGGRQRGKERLCPWTGVGLGLVKALLRWPGIGAAQGWS